jgi:aminoglycoside 3-N-acetyltransferase
MSVLHTVNRLLMKIFPEKIYKNLRLKLLALNRLRMHTFSEKEIKEILDKEMGVKPGAVVFVHSSMNQLKLDFPFFRLIEILKDSVGEEGTILFPCWQNLADPKAFAANKIFDVKRTPTDLGLLPEFVRRQKGAQRSLSPWNSVVAIGKDADVIVKDHHLDPLTCGFKSPFYQLFQRKGIIIGLGVQARYLSFVHCPEDTYPGTFPVQTRETENTIFKVKTLAGEIVDVGVRLPHSNIKHRNIQVYLKKHIAAGTAREFKVKGSNFFVADAANLYNEMQKLAAKGITIYNM